MTNSTFELLCQLRNLSINLETDGDRLRCHAPEGVLTPTLRQEIATRKTEIIFLLQEAKQLTISEQLSIQPVPRDGKLPLSFAQQRLWFVHQISPESTAYNLLEALRLDGSPNIVALEQSLNELIRRHEVLRTSFPTVDGNPIQLIAPPTALTLPIHDLQGLSAEEQTAQIRQIAKSVASKPFDLAVGPLVEFTLLQLSNQEYVLLLKMHHIIYDGWSLNIFFGELSQLYAAFAQGLPNPLPELPIQYADFAFWQRQWLTGSVLDRQLAYWQQQLAGVPPVLELPSVSEAGLQHRSRPPVQTFRGGIESFQLDHHLTQRLKQLSQESDTTLFMTLLAAFLVLISRYSGQLDIVVGSPIANRNSPQIEQLMGFFANTLALRGNLSGNPSFADFLAQVRQTTLSAYAHQDLPFEMLVEKLQIERDLSRNPLVQVIFSLQNAPQSSSNLSGLTIQNMPLPIDITVRFDLEVNYWEGEGGLEGVWSYSTDLFDATTITRIAQHFQTLLKAIVANPQERISELPLLSPAERHQLLVEWNDTQVDYPSDKCIHQLFEEQVERTPNAVAVVYENEQLTYHELNCHANQLAHYLQYLGVGADELVGICVERSPLMVVGMLAILKAGGAYVPLDPEYPQERLQFMLADTQVKVLLTQEKLVKSLTQHQAHVVCLDTDWQSIRGANQHNINSIVSCKNLSYVIYTSGSTGTPKGVAVTHQAVNRLVLNTNYIQLTPDDCIAQAANIAFDAATFEIWGALLTGAKLVIITKSVLLLPKEFAASICDYQISVLFLTTALFNQLASFVPEAFSSLRYLLFGGEAVDPFWVQQVLDKGAPHHLLHVYGPTENTTFSSWYLVEDLPTKATTISIGRPIANTQIYILDEYLQPAPVGVPGELHLGGAGLARGYLNARELTQEKFISNPFSTDPNSRLYKTGDKVRYLSDGNIEYIGRIDNQVKIRGFRIELGEIEAVLSQHSNVQVSCVIVREDTPGDTSTPFPTGRCTSTTLSDHANGFSTSTTTLSTSQGKPLSTSKRLVAYIVPQKDVTPTTTELRQFLANKLPLYMVPYAFVILESLPLTQNGKIDRRALKAPSNTSDLDKFVEARNQLELQLVQIWSKILKVDKVGVQDNFFDLGGHSLLAPYLMAQIKQQFGKDFPLTTLFHNPTIEQLATIVQTDSDYSNSSCLVAIQSNGSNLPFFCVPGVGGKPFYLYNLVRYLGTDQPLYSFQAQDLDGELEPVTRIEDMASNYIQAMQAVQPQGPYFLGGHSFGGKVVFEMAQQLLHQGHEIALLVMIDASAPSYQEKQIATNYIDWDHARWLNDLIQAVESYLKMNLDISYDTLQSLAVDEQLKYVLQHLKMVNILPPNAETTQLKNMVQVYRANSLSVIDYVPQQIYPAQITLLRANEVLLEETDGDDLYNEFCSEIVQDSGMGWSKFSTEPIDIHIVPGNHVTMTAEPHVQVLAERLKACIQKARE